MDLPILWLIIILLFLLLLSAFFSGSETGLVASNKYRLQSLAKKGDKRAKLSIKLLNDIDSLIGTILLGNNFVNILAASIATIIAINLYNEEAVFLSSLLLTIIVLIFAETAPKTFAAKNPEKVALFASPILRLLIWLFQPIVWIVKHIARLFLNVLGIRHQKEDTSVELDELKMSVIDAKENIDDTYYQILLNIIDLKLVTVDDIMIPKTEFIGVELTELEEAIKIISSSNHTRLVTYEHGEIIGILHMRKIANLYVKNQFTIENIKAIIAKPYFIPEGISLAVQLAEFQKYKKRLGLVVDEYGEIKGMIALEDILEEIVGQFTSNTTEVIEDIILQEDGSYLVEPSVNLHKLNRKLGLSLKANAKTLNGLILETLQSIPKRDVSFKIDNIIVEIIQIHETTIKLVKLTILSATPHLEQHN